MNEKPKNKPWAPKSDLDAEEEGRRLSSRLEAAIAPARPVLDQFWDELLNQTPN